MFIGSFVLLPFFLFFSLPFRFLFSLFLIPFFQVRRPHSEIMCLVQYAILGY